MKKAARVFQHERPFEQVAAHGAALPPRGGAPRRNSRRRPGPWGRGPSPWGAVGPRHH